MTNIPSSNVSFSPLQGSVADYVLNHPTASPFKKHNISFHIGGNYLNDFSDKGIKQFVKQNDSKLSFQEVGTFIQTAAANAPKLAGATFNLADPELGLGKKDDIKQEHIRTGFTLETKSGTLPAKDVVFFDATKASFPLQDAEKAVKEAEQKVKGLERDLGKAQGNVEDAQYLRQRLVDFLGKDSPKDLAEKQSVVQSMEGKITELKADRGNYETYLKQLEEEHNSQSPNPPSGLDQNTRWQRIGQMKHAIRGLDLEIKDSEKALSDAKKSISAKQGPLNFMGVGNSLSELHDRNQNLNKAQTQLGQVRTQLDSARTVLKDAQDLRARILRGESIAQPQPPVQAPAEPAKPEPAKPPVAQEPIAPKPPLDTKPEPVVIAPTPTTPPVVAEPSVPAQPAPVAEQPTAPAQPPVAQEPVAPAPPSGPFVSEPFIPGHQTNAPFTERPVGEGPAPVVQPPVTAPSQPTTPPPSSVVAEPIAPSQPTAPSTPVGGVTLNPDVMKKYTVKKGDTLSSIARTQLGDWKRWPDIANANKQVIGNNNTHWIYPGQVLSLPPLQVRQPAN